MSVRTSPCGQCRVNSNRVIHNPDRACVGTIPTAEPLLQEILFHSISHKRIFITLCLLLNSRILSSLSFSRNSRRYDYRLRDGYHLTPKLWRLHHMFLSNTGQCTSLPHEVLNSQRQGTQALGKSSEPMPWLLHGQVDIQRFGSYLHPLAIPNHFRGRWH